MSWWWWKGLEPPIEGQKVICGCYLSLVLLHVCVMNTDFLTQVIKTMMTTMMLMTKCSRQA